MPKNWQKEHEGCSRQGGACWTPGTFKHGECSVWSKRGMVRRKYVWREEGSRARSHRACRSWKEKLLFHSKQQELKKLPGTICLVCKPQSNLCIRLHLPYPHIRNGLRISFYLLWSKALGMLSLLLLTEINFSIVFKYRLFSLESQFGHLLVPKKNCQSSSYITVYNM